ncbi:MAG: SBBP repeat-containing protein, partial [Thermoplasmata archaeon]|nr:SBBP repeat-containing protein [Thermoplasmata archaeon]
MELNVLPPSMTELFDAFEGFEGFFTENRGQVENREVLYIANGDPLSLGITSDGVVFRMLGEDFTARPRPEMTSTSPRDSSVFRLRFLDSEPVIPTGQWERETRTNYFIGRDPEGWLTDIPSFDEVMHKGLYEGIDLRFYFIDGMFKYDLIFDPWVDPTSVVIGYEGVEGLSIHPVTGDLLIKTSQGVIRDDAPVVFEEMETSGHGVPCDFRLLDRTRVTFDLPEGIDLSRGIVIDPGMQYSTLLGGTSSETVTDVETDDWGNVYVIGMTYSDDFPTTSGAYSSELLGGRDMFITKFDPSLSRLLFSTYFGGDEELMEREECYNIEIVSSEGLYINGHCNHDDFPTTPDAVFNERNGEADCFLLKMSLSGSELLYSTFLGGTDNEHCKGLTIDTDGSVFIAGATYSHDFPTTFDAYCVTIASDRDDPVHFIMKLSPDLRHIIACTLIDSIGYEYFMFWVRSIIGLGTDGSIYLGTSTNSRSWPTTEGAYCRTYGGGPRDAAVVRFSNDLTQLLAGTYVGTSGDDWVESFDVTGDTPILGGATDHNGYPITPNAFDKKLQATDVFVTVLDSNLTSIEFSSFFGGSGEDDCHQLRANGGRFYFGGWESSPNLDWSPGCYDPSFNGGPEDHYLAAVNLTTWELEYVTYLGGGAREENLFLDFAFNQLGDVIMCGRTSSDDFPTTKHAYQKTRKSATYDAYIAIISPEPVPVPPAPSLNAVSGDRRAILNWTLDIEWSTIERYKIYRGRDPDNLMAVNTISVGNEWTNTGL